MTTSMALALALLSGIFGWLIYPNIDVWPLVFVCNTPLMLALRRGGTRKRIFFLGWTTGFVLTFGSHHFIAGTLVNLAKLPVLVAWPVFGLYAAWTGIQLGLFALGFAWLRRRSGPWLWLLTAPILFVVLERHFPVWFQAYLSNVLWHAPVLTQALEWVGPSGLSALIVLAQCALVQALESEHAPRQRWAPLVGSVALWLALWAWGDMRMTAVEDAPVRQRVTITMLQPNVTVAQKSARGPAVRAGLWESIEAETLTAAADAPDLMIWPEGAFPFQYRPGFGDTQQQAVEKYSVRYSRRLHALARRLPMPFVAPGLRKADDGTVRNSAMIFQPGVAEPTVYDKRVLVPLAERIPLADTFPSLVKQVPGASHHAPGDHFVTFEAGGARWAASICYEAVFPGVTRAALAFEGGADVLLNLTNDVWFGHSSEGPVHLMMQVPRAVENRKWLVRVTNTGISAIVSPAGRIVARTEQGEQTRLTYVLPVIEL
ncbi:MAG: apolipoprotein N-acyltransferase, partial [Myxococcota bacterium]